MTTKPIKNETEYQAALSEIETLFDAAANTPSGDRLEVLTILVEDYERRHYPVGLPDPIAALEYHLESRGMTPEDLKHYLGSQANVTAILQRTRPLSMDMIRRLHTGLGISADVLIQPYDLQKRTA